MMDLAHKLKAMRDRWREERDKHRHMHPEDAGRMYNEALGHAACDLDALIREYEGYVCVPMEPEDRRLDRLCFSPEAGMPTREQARIIYQIVASD